MSTRIQETFTSSQRPKKIQFSAETDAQEVLRENRKKQAEILDLLYKSDGTISSNLPQSIVTVDAAIQKAKEYFEEGGNAYNKLMAKCLIWKLIRMPVDQREPLEQVAEKLDPTDEKFSIYKGVPF